MVMDRCTSGTPADGLCAYETDPGVNRCDKTVSIPIVYYTFISAVAQIVLTQRFYLPLSA